LDGEQQLELNGQTFSWVAERDRVAVWHPTLGRRTAEFGGSRQLPEALARMLAREMMDNARNANLED
jgi:hypothetical protein